MTKEQGIKELNSLIKVNKGFFENQGNMLINKRDIEAIETVLSMLKQKDKEIEKKDKIIDLMAEYINHLSDELVQTTGRNELEFCDGNKCCKDSEYSCEQCIKQYFERKSEE